MSTSKQNRLTLLVKRFIDITWFLFLFFAVVWPLVVLVVGLNISPVADQRHTDVEVFSSFRITSDFPARQAVPDMHKGGPLVSGKGELRLNDTSSRLSWYLSGAISEIMLFIAIFGLLAMRKLFSSLVDGNAFTSENARHIRTIGYAVIAWHIVSPLLQYFGSRIMLDDIAFSVPGIELYPGFELNIGGVFAGLAIIVLAGVMREAANIYAEQSLTI